MAEEQVRIDSLPLEQFKAAREAGATTTIAKSEVEDSTPPKITSDDTMKEFKEKREEQQQGHRNRGAEKRIERLLKDRGAARAEAASLKERLARYENGPANSNGAEPQEQSQESESYSGRSEERSAPTVEDNPKFQALRERYSDFDQVMERSKKEGMRISNEAAKVLHSLEHGGDIAYRLASDDEARIDFNKLPPARQVEEIRRADAERGKYVRVQPFLQKIKETFSDDEISEVVEAEKKNKIGADLAFSMTKELHDLPNGPEVWRHIVKDTTISKRLNQMSPSQRTLELGRISARLEVDEPPVSRLPTPITPVGRGSARTSISLDDMDLKDFKRARADGRIR